MRGSASFASRCAVGVESGQQRLRRDGDGDHFAPLFAPPDRVHADARTRLREQTHVRVDLRRVRQLGRRTRNVTERGRRRRHGRRRRQIIHEGREKERLGRVLVNLARVRGVQWLARIPSRPCCRWIRLDAGRDGTRWRRRIPARPEAKPRRQPAQSRRKSTERTVGADASPHVARADPCAADLIEVTCGPYSYASGEALRHAIGRRGRRI